MDDGRKNDTNNKTNRGRDLTDISRDGDFTNRTSGDGDFTGKTARGGNPASRASYGESLALAYDALMREDYSYARYTEYIEKVFAKYGVPPGASIADLGCGTGSMCVELAIRGYEVIGIDNSQHMLAEAREKAMDNGLPDILFLEQDISEFELFGTVDAFISTIDSINYITDKRRLRRLFKLVDNYLIPGGIFIFDVNTVYKLSKYIGNNFFYNISDNMCYLWINKYNGASGISEFDLTIFIPGRGGDWRRFDETHRQRAYSQNDIRAALSGTDLKIEGAYNFLCFERPSGNAKKTSYILKKI